MVAAGVATALLLANGMASAQENGDAEQALSLEEIVVTGTHIRGVAAPVGSDLTVVDSQALMQFPASNAVESLNRLPGFAAIGYNATMKTVAGPGSQGGNSSRASDINLRGIGPRATLVLFDGARRPPSGSTGKGTDSSMMPMLALERVEVVADGGSAIYGSDAVAGVVNFVPRKTFDGIEGRVRYGVADGYDTQFGGIVAGREWSDGGFVITAEINKQSNLSGRDRDYFRSDLTSRGGRDYRSTDCGNITVGGVTYAIPAGGITPATADQLVPGTVNRCEITRQADILPEQEIKSVYGSFEQQIGERLTVNVHGLWSERDWKTLETEAGSQHNHMTFVVPETNAFFVRPPGTTGALQVSYNFGPDYGLIESNGAVEYKNIGAGLELRITDNWRATLKHDYSEIDDRWATLGVLTSELNAALASSDPAVAFNPFAPAGSNGREKVAGLFLNYFDPTAMYELRQTRFSIDGRLFELPAGAVRLALGGELYELEAVQGNRTGDVRTLSERPFVPRNVFEREVKSGFAEVFVPIVDGDTPGLRKLELSAAVRHDDYSDFGSTTNPKFGINWSPTDSLLVRASYGTSFIAPALGDTVSPSLGGALTYASRVDPLSPTGTSVGAIWTDNNPDLDPEEAETYSFGVEYTPDWASGLTLKGTYFAIDYDGQVGSINSNTALQNPNAAAFVTRNPTDAQLDAAAATGIRIVGARPTEVAFLIDARLHNLGGSRMRGIDASARYDWATGNGHQWAAEVSGTYLLKYDSAVLPTDNYVSRLDEIYNPLRLNMRGVLSWTNGPLFAEGVLNHTGGYKNTLVAPIQKVDSYSTVDLRFGANLTDLFESVSFAKNMTLSLEVVDLFDEEPPFVDIDGGANFSASSPLGRRVSVTFGVGF
jgi:iron complex outermembrane receptor protein